MAARLNNHFLLAQLRNLKRAFVAKGCEDTLPPASAVLSCVHQCHLLHTLGSNKVGKHLSRKSHSDSLERQASATFYSSLQSACAFAYPAAANNLNQALTIICTWTSFTAWATEWFWAKPQKDCLHYRYLQIFLFCCKNAKTNSKNRQYLATGVHKTDLLGCFCNQSGTSCSQHPQKRALMSIIRSWACETLQQIFWIFEQPSTRWGSCS